MRRVRRVRGMRVVPATARGIVRAMGMVAVVGVVTKLGDRGAAVGQSQERGWCNGCGLRNCGLRTANTESNVSALGLRACRKCGREGSCKREKKRLLFHASNPRRTHRSLSRTAHNNEAYLWHPRKTSKRRRGVWKACGDISGDEGREGSPQRSPSRSHFSHIAAANRLLKPTPFVLSNRRSPFRIWFGHIRRSSGPCPGWPVPSQAISASTGVTRSHRSGNADCQGEAFRPIQTGGVSLHPRALWAANDLAAGFRVSDLDPRPFPGSHFPHQVS